MISGPSPSQFSAEVGTVSSRVGNFFVGMSCSLSKICGLVAGKKMSGIFDRTTSFTVVVPGTGEARAETINGVGICTGKGGSGTFGRINAVIAAHRF